MNADRAFRLKLLVFGVLPKALRRRVYLRFMRRQVENYSEPELLALRPLVPSDEVAIDVGSNMGVYAYALAGLTRRVIAYEPNPVLASMVRRLGLPKIEMRQAAVSAEAGTADLIIPANGSFVVASLDEWVVRDRGALTRVRVPVVCLDDEADEKVGFIKIDVEGLEEQVLAGAARLLARDKPKLLVEVEERHNAGGLARIVAKLRPLGYSGYFLQDGRWSPVADFDAAIHQNVGAVEAAQRLGHQMRYFNNFLFTTSSPASVK